MLESRHLIQVAAFVLFGLFSFTTIRICYTLFQRLTTLFFLQGVPPYKQNSSVFSFKGVPLAEKTELKVLGREFEGKPFFKRVSLNNMCKASIWVSTICLSFFIAVKCGVRAELSGFCQLIPQIFSA